MSLITDVIRPFLDCPFIKVNKTKETFKLFEQWIIRTLRFSTECITCIFDNGSGMWCLHASQINGVLKWTQILWSHASNGLCYWQWYQIPKNEHRWAIQIWQLFWTHILPLYLRFHQTAWDAMNCPERLHGKLSATASLSSVFPSISCIILSWKWRTENILYYQILWRMQKNLWCKRISCASVFTLHFLWRQIVDTLKLVSFKSAPLALNNLSTNFIPFLLLV